MGNISGNIYFNMSFIFVAKFAVKFIIRFVFQAFEKYTKVENVGYTSISNVRNTYNTRPLDKTESFWFAETLKYMYLLFDDTRQLINLDKWVFNSEGHPLPIYDS